MRWLLTLVLGLFSLSPVLAQDEPMRLMAHAPGLYDIEVRIDPGLTAYGEVHASLLSEELDGLREMAQLAVADHARWMADAPEWSWNGYFSSTDIGIAFAGRGVISLSRETSYYTGGAHPNQGLSPVLTRTDSYDPIALADLFEDPSVDSPAMTALFYAVYRELMAMKRERLGGDFDESMERETWLASLAADAGAFPGFTLIPNQAGDAAAGLMFHFEPYVVGSYVEGSYSVPVPLSVFADFLGPDWSDVFDGAPDLDVLTAPGDALEPLVSPSRD